MVPVFFNAASSLHPVSRRLYVPGGVVQFFAFYLETELFKPNLSSLCYPTHSAIILDMSAWQYVPFFRRTHRQRCFY